MKIKQCAVLTLAAFNLAGCVGVKAVNGPDGREAHAITCSGTNGADWSDCFQKAGDICGTRGYKVWNQAAGQSAMISGSDNAIFGGSSETRTLLISCKTGDPAAAE